MRDRTVLILEIVTGLVAVCVVALFFYAVLVIGL